MNAMGTVYDRDENEQLKFGCFLEDFSDSVRELCLKTKSHICEARDNIRDDAPTEAMDYLDELIDRILDQLPGVAEFGEKQKKQAKDLMQRDEPLQKLLK